MQDRKTRTIASFVMRCCAGASAYTLKSGYAFVTRPSAHRILFPPARTLEERRNASGRCTRFVGEYPDRSRICFTYSSNGGATLTATPPRV